VIPETHASLPRREAPRRGLAGWARQYRAGLAISAAVCLLSLGLYVPVYLGAHPSPLFRFFADIELRTLDLRFRMRGARPPGPAVVIVAIDEKSEDQLGRWPFPRRYLAEAVDFLGQAQARVIAFDINFPQPDENSSLEALRRARKDYSALGLSAAGNPRFARELELLEAEADNDRKFAEALSRYPNAVLGYFFLFRTQETVTQDRERVKAFQNYLSFQAYPQVVHPEYGKWLACSYCEALGLSPNLRQFAAPAKNFGFFNVIPDSDGTVRREPVLIRFQGGYYPSLDVAAVLAYRNLPLEQVAVFFNPNGLERIDLGPLRVPTDPDGYVQIDFHGPSGAFPTYSLADLVTRRLPPELFRDRLVLIGPTASGIGDMAVTPYQKMAFPGVEAHANFIENLLAGHFIRRGLRENLADIAFILLFSLAAGMLLAVVPPVRAEALLLVVLGIFFWLAYYLFAAHRIWIAVFLPTATFTLNYAAIVSYRFFFEEREKRKVRGAFQHYVAPSVINLLLRQPALLQLGGEEKELTVMFSDIRGFTSLSENLAPSVLVDLLNEYFSEMTEVIFRHWGTLDKYIGDAIMAFWGAPYPQTDHARRACAAALEMRRTLNRLRSRWEATGQPRLEIGVGINTGDMLVGNMGSTRRFNFTIMGDNVNLASRLEGLNKSFGTSLIVSESTYQAARQQVVARELDLIRVKGKLKPVKIYELLGATEDQEQLRDLLERFHQGLAFYRNGQWGAGLEAFEALLHDFPADGPSRVFAERCRHFLAHPPEAAWDGIYVMKTK